MKKFLLHSSLLAVVIMAVSCEKTKTEEPAKPDVAAITAEIQKMEDAYAKDMADKKTDAITAYYASDAQSFPPEEKPIIGRDSIIASLKKEMAGIPAGASVVYKTKEVLPSSDGLQVVEIGTFTALDSIKNIKMSGNFISVFQKRDGKYVCVRDMAVHDTPKPKK